MSRRFASQAEGMRQMQVASLLGVAPGIPQHENALFGSLRRLQALGALPWSPLVARVWASEVGLQDLSKKWRTTARVERL